MTETGAKVLGVVSTLLTGSVFLYFGIAAYGRGEEIGPFMSFMGMLVWASTQREFDRAIALAQQALAGWKQTLDRIGEQHDEAA